MSLTDLLEMQHLTYTRKKKSKRRVGAKSLVHTGYLLLGNRPSVLLEISEMKGKYIISEKKWASECLRKTSCQKYEEISETHILFQTSRKIVCVDWNEKPSVLKNEPIKTGYNKFTLGVKKENQIVPYYSRRRKPLKLPKKIILFLPQTPALNSSLKRNTRHKNQKNTDFILNCVQKMTDPARRENDRDNGGYESLAQKSTLPRAPPRERLASKCCVYL